MRHVTRYGKEVWENDKFEDQRKENCMCLQCGRMKPSQPEKHCKIASKFFEICKEHGCAFILTRCTDWIPNLQEGDMVHINCPVSKGVGPDEAYIGVGCVSQIFIDTNDPSWGEKIAQFGPIIECQLTQGGTGYFDLSEITKVSTTYPQWHNIANNMKTKSDKSDKSDKTENKPTCTPSLITCPENWIQATFNVNPETGEIHAYGHESVRKLIEKNFAQRIIKETL